MGFPALVCAGHTLDPLRHLTVFSRRQQNLLRLCDRGEAEEALRPHQKVDQVKEKEIFWAAGCPDGQSLLMDFTLSILHNESASYFSNTILHIYLGPLGKLLRGCIVSL